MQQEAKASVDEKVLIQQVPAVGERDKQQGRIEGNVQRYGFHNNYREYLLFVASHQRFT